MLTAINKCGILLTEVNSSVEREVSDLNLNVKAIYGLIGERHKGNLKNFCEELKLDYTGVWKVLNEKSDGTAKFIPALFEYCKKHNLNFNDFIT